MIRNGKRFFDIVEIPSELDEGRLVVGRQGVEAHISLIVDPQRIAAT
jgi:hypothetical protein